MRLRWFGVVGQLLTVCFVYLGLGFPLPFGICLGLIALSAWLNVFLRIRYPARTRLSRVRHCLLAYDILQLAALLYLTGGIENPFMFLLVAPVTVSAATLPPRNTIALGLLGAGATAFLVFYHSAAVGSGGGGSRSSAAHLQGRHAGLGAGGHDLPRALRLAARQGGAADADALAATEMVLAREQQLHALDGLAAAAAHELGTRSPPSPWSPRSSSTR